jgi:hypothetical protein
VLIAPCLTRWRISGGMLTFMREADGKAARL